MNLKNFLTLYRNETIGFIGHGHSLNEFIKHRDYLISKDIVWGSLNQYWIAENVLKQRLDFVVFQSGVYRNFWHDGSILQWDRKVNRNRGKCTLFSFLEKCIENNFKRIILFGFDGYTDKDNKYFSIANPNQYIGHKKDCEFFNNNFPYNTKNTEIINCSINSNYKPFKKVTYEQLRNKL
jgi:hypothetical protein